MVGRRKSIAFEDLKRYWGEVIFAKPPKIHFGKYDLVVAQEPTLRIGPPAYLAAKLCGAKFIIEVHGGYLGRWLKGANGKVATIMLKKADLVRVVNENIARQLRGMKLKKVITIPAIYIKTDVFRPIKRHSERDNLVLYAGRFVFEKNLPLLIKAFRHVVKEEPSAKLLLIGEGPEKNLLRRLIISEGIEENARILNRWLSHKELASYYNDAAIFALTSYYEGGPRAICEAGACRTPFISTPVGILPEIIENGVGGFFLESREPLELAEKIIIMLQDHQLREKMGENFRRVVIEHFEWGKAVKRYAEAYLKFYRERLD